MNDVMNKYKNPFPVTAVANFYNNMQNNLIVETKVIKEMKDIVKRWYTLGDEGVTVAIQGEYGTGKTQLAIEMRKYIKKHDEGKYHFVCLDSPSISFIEMYKNRFLNEITKKEVLERLEEYYLDIVLQDLKKEEVYKNIFYDRNKILKSYDLIKHLGLPKSRYDRVLKSELEEVTSNAKFVPALLLLMMPQFEEDVWRWLNGAEPTEALKERSIDFVINNDVLALEAIGVFSFLFGKKEHRLVLFIDEMEKIMSNPRQTQNEIIEALKKLFETVKCTKSLLILCGLPDYYDVLPKDAKERIGHEIKTEAITLKEISNYIIRANMEKNNISDIVPFTEQILKNILDIARGNIRTIIRLLYHSSNWYLDNQRMIDENALCIILKNAYGTFDIENITSVVTQLIISKGWLFEEKKKLEEKERKVEIDIWIPIMSGKKNTKEKGIEIYIIQNLISDDEYGVLYDRISDSKETYKIVIVEGFITPKYKELLLKKIQRIMEYRIRDFKELLISVVEGEKAKYENMMSQNNLLAVNEKIESLSRIINRIWTNMNENMIGKKEFYYFMKKLISNENDVFYKMPDKDSEFYLIINEIQRLLERNSKVVFYNNSECDIGIFYFIREITYIIYYMVEEPQKIEIFYSSKDIYEICRNLRYILEEMMAELDFSLMEQLEKYNFLLEYLSHCMEQRDLATTYPHKRREREFYIDNLYEIDNIYEVGNIYEVSHHIRQVSQKFCAYVLINEPETFVVYSSVFNSFYFFLNVIEPNIIQRKMGYVDLTILREYYDLIMREVSNMDRIISRPMVSRLFEHYETTLRRFMNEAE